MMKLRIPRLSAAVLLRRMALSYLIVWVLSPPLAYGASWRVLALMSMSIWLAVEFRSPRSVLIRPNLGPSRFRWKQRGMGRSLVVSTDWSAGA